MALSCFRARWSAPHRRAHAAPLTDGNRSLQLGITPVQGAAARGLSDESGGNLEDRRRGKLSEEGQNLTGERLSGNDCRTGESLKDPLPRSSCRRDRENVRGNGVRAIE